MHKAYIVHVSGQDYRFDHSAVCDAAYAVLSPSAKQYYHLAVAEAIKDSACYDSHTKNVLLVHHYERSGKPELCLPHAKVIANKAFASGEFDLAIEYYTIAAKYDFKGSCLDISVSLFFDGQYERFHRFCKNALTNFDDGNPTKILLNFENELFKQNNMRKFTGGEFLVPSNNYAPNSKLTDYLSNAEQILMEKELDARLYYRMVSALALFYIATKNISKATEMLSILTDLTPTNVTEDLNFIYAYSRQLLGYHAEYKNDFALAKRMYSEGMYFSQSKEMWYFFLVFMYRFGNVARLENDYNQSRTLFTSGLDVAKLHGLTHFIDKFTLALDSLPQNT